MDLDEADNYMGACEQEWIDKGGYFEEVTFHTATSVLYT